MKKMSAVLALFLLAAALTACTGTAQNTRQEDTAPPSTGDAGASDPAAIVPSLWTETEIRSLFEEKTAGKGYTALSCVPADDGAYDLAGVVLYTTAEGDRTNLAFLGGDGYYQTCGVMALPWEDGSLSYQGDGAVTFQVLDQDGAALDYQMSISIDGANVHFDVASDAADS